MGAKLNVNSADLTEKLKSFNLECESCGSADVSLDIETPDNSGLNVFVWCEKCKHNQEIISQ